MNESKMSDFWTGRMTDCVLRQTGAIFGKYKWFLVFTVAYFARVLYLDADVHSYMLNQIQPVDEMYYNEIAYNIGTNGICNFLISGPGKITVPNAKSYLIPNILTGLFLNLFGKNYRALRMTSLLAGYVIMCLLIKGFQKCSVVSGSTACMAVGVLYISDLSSLTLTRSAIPISACMLAETLFCFMIFLYKEDSCRLGFVLGCTPVISFCCVYMGMPYLLLAGFVILLLFCWKKRHKSDSVKALICFYLLGSAVGIVVCDLLDRIFLKESIFEVITDVLMGFSVKINESVMSGMKVYLLQSRQFWMSNMFRYNPLLLFLFISALLAYFMITISERKVDDAASALLAIVICHWLLTIVVNNATLSKASISTGTVILFSLYMTDKVSKTYIKYRLFFGAACLACLLWFLGFLLEASAFTYQIKCIMIPAQFAAFGFMAVQVCAGRFRKIFIALSLLTFLSISVWLDIYYVFSKVTFDDIKVSQNAGRIVGNGVAIGGFPLGFAMYNDIKPIFGTYDRYVKHGYDAEIVAKTYPLLVGKYEELYYIGYSGDDQLSLINSWISKTPYVFEIVEIFNRSYYAYVPGDSDIMICKKVRKQQ